MGNTSSVIATNILDSHNKVLTSVINSTNQNCSVACYNDLTIEFDCSAEECFLGNPDPNNPTYYSQACSIDVNCILYQETQNCLQTQLGITSKQTADAASGLLNGSLFAGNFLNNTDVRSNNLVYLFNELNQNVYNNIQQDCYASSYNKATIDATCKESTSKKCVLVANINQVADNVINCALTGSNFTQIESSITEQIDQMASATTKSAIGAAALLLIAIAIIAAIIFFSTIGIVKLVVIIFALAIVFIGFYFLWCYVAKCGPFTPPGELVDGAKENETPGITYKDPNPNLESYPNTVNPETIAYINE